MNKFKIDEETVLKNLESFECLKEVMDDIKNDTFKKKHLITTIISESKEFISIGGAQIVNKENEEKYCRHHNHLKLIKKENPQIEIPQLTSRCLCFHHITHNRYIKNINTGKIYVVGSCCINKFINEELQGRRCSQCNNRHRHSKDNLCKDCRDVIKKEKKKAIEAEKLKRAIQKKIEDEERWEYIRAEQERVYQEDLKNREIEKENEFRRDGICKFGKYKDTPYIDIFNNDKKYITNWALNTYKKNLNELGYIKKDNIYYLLKLYKEFINN